jgi:cytochrome c-type biogenesis protein CcmH/NrfF
VALAGTAALIWMFPALVVIAGGILCLAAYAIDTRLEALSADPEQ